MSKENFEPSWLLPPAYARRRARDDLSTDLARSGLPLCLSLYVPVIPAARAARCGPCPVALVPALCCCPRPVGNPDLLRSALSGNIIPGVMFILMSKRSLHHSDTSGYPARKQAAAHLDDFARSWTRLGRRCPRRPDSPLVHPGAGTHGEIRARNAPARFGNSAISH